ncbi:hypothetical protein ACN38_g11697, partial [Penicillium nordicum]
MVRTMSLGFMRHFQRLNVAFSRGLLQPAPGLVSYKLG